MDDLVTIIIPAYNCESSIVRCLDSIKNQQYQKLQVLIINDGSRDNSESIIEQYIKINALNDWELINLENKGVANARNVGLSKAKGKFVAFVDSDDFVDDFYIEDMILNMQKNNSDWCIAGYKRFNNNIKQMGSGFVPDSKYYNSINDFLNYDSIFVNGLIHPCWAKLYKMDIIVNNNIQVPKQSLSEDTSFNINYLQHIQSVSCLRNSSYIYVISSSDTLSNSLPDDIFDLYLKIHKQFIDIFNEYNGQEIIINKMMYAQYYSAILKILINSSLSYFDKKMKIDYALNNKIIEGCFQIKNENNVINIINKTLVNRKYLFTMFLLKISQLKGGVM